MHEIGLHVPPSGTAHTLDEAMAAVERVGLPVIIRPAYILGGKGTGIATTPTEFERLAATGLAASPISEILIERSIAGWKEYELEVMRDRADNCVVVCSIENLDPMGVHTGDSITVAPAQTLSDVEYQRMRDAAFACIRRVGVETGGSNMQFALDPTNGEMVVIEMNPRVSRSSALASKATGFPIAKIAARLAVGYTLDEIPNDITRKTPASFEPTIDYVVTKVPRWAFEKFPGTPAVLGTPMQSVGEAMAIGRTFPESLQKALRSLEHGRAGLNCDPAEARSTTSTTTSWCARAAIATPDRPFQLEAALRRGHHRRRPGRADQGRPVVPRPDPAHRRGARPPGGHRARRHDPARLAAGQAARLHRRPARLAVGQRRRRRAGRPRSPPASRPRSRPSTPAAPSSRPRRRTTTRPTRTRTRSRPSGRRKVVILGSGPNRIGQGIEFDYCCVHASFALGEAGFETVMVNCNPETVSTDYDTSDRLYFEPLTLEDVLNVIEAEQAAGDLVGVIVALGGQTPLKLAGSLPAGLVLGTVAGVDRPGRGPRAVERPVRPARDPAAGGRHGHHGRRRPGHRRAHRLPGARCGPPTCSAAGPWRSSTTTTSCAGPWPSWPASARSGSEGGLSAERPVLIDRFLEDATEVDVDAIRDAHRRGASSAGSWSTSRRPACTRATRPASIPPHSLGADTVAVIEDYTRRIADALDVRGLINVQYAVKQGQVFVIEANPRASRTVPFVAKATGVPLVKVAARVMVGATLAELRAEGLLRPPVEGGHVAVKEAVLPFNRFPDVDTVLGPEMRSTGEVMGIDRTFGLAFAKARLGAGTGCPTAAPSSCRWPTATRPPACGPPAVRRARLHDRRHRRAPPRTSSAAACPSPSGWPR